MKQAVLLLAHGAPEKLEDIDDYLDRIRSSRPGAGPTPPQVVQEVKHRYAEIGGSSPLLQWTRRQAEALQVLLSVPVYFGMRNWHPSIREAMERIAADRTERLVAICLAPQYSKMSVGLYFRRTQEAKTETGAQAEIVWTKSFHTHPRLVEAFAERLAPLAGKRRVLFTAHSLPEKILESADPYDAEARATARAVADFLKLPDWDFAYQSQGMTGEKWLGPTVESCLDRYAAEGVREVVLHPIGFVCDHVEILYDVDIHFRKYAQERRIELFRPETLNDSPKFIAALADVAREKLILPPNC
jgi:protoporphyrin/coproporphyrin ferrochelatase